MTVPTEYYKVIRREPNLVCYWRLNDLTGTRALDWAGKYNLNGIYDGSPINDVPLIYNDIGAGSKLFGGANQNMEVPNAVPLQITSDITIEMWVISLSEKQSAYLLSKRNNTFAFSNPYSVGLESGKVFFSLGNGVSRTVITTFSALQASVPLHIVATMSRNKMKIFVDGVESASGSLGAQEVKDGGNPVFAGELGNNTSRFNGMIGELAVYSGGLGATEIKNHFAIGRQIIYKKPYYTTFDRPSYS